MVQIMINRDPSLDECFIIELQGELKLKGENNQKLGDNFIGDLHFNKENIPILIIGHHILFGKCVHLDKPMAVMQKRTSTRNEDDNNDESTTDYIVKSIIRRKIEFRLRPKPIVVMEPTKP